MEKIRMTYAVSNLIASQINHQKQTPPALMNHLQPNLNH